VPGLGASFGRGAATTYQQDLANSDCILIMGSNMAEAHPVGFRFPMKAKERGATLIHVDPRFSRTSALCDQHVQIRAGSDIVFLGGLINHVLTTERWFREYVLAYTNAATIIEEGFEDTEDLGGVFSGLDPETGLYDPEAGRWGYAGQSTALGAEQAKSESDSAGQHGMALQGGGDTGEGHRPAAPVTDPTLQHPHCVMNLLRRHYARYTPEMVARACGCSEEAFLKVAESLCANSGRERTSAIVYAVGWTQHTTGVQIIRAAAILQLLLGNMGRPGGGIMAMRGHASIQGSTDLSTLYDQLPGYLPQPRAEDRHETLDAYCRAEGLSTGGWSSFRAYAVSLLKAWYGDAATPANDFGFGWLPRLDGDYSQLPFFRRMANGEVNGYFVLGQNPAGGGPNAGLHRAGLRQLDWLVVADWFMHETATFWKSDPAAPPPDQIKTEVFFIPAAAAPEKEGTFTNTQRLLQWHDRAVDPPGDCRSDAWFIYQLGKQLKELYANSDDSRDSPLRALTWDYGHDEPVRLPDGSFSRIEGEPDLAKVLQEINGHALAETDAGTGKPRLLTSFAELKDDGSTACGCWIYNGVFPAYDRSRARDREITENPVQPSWGYAWPLNRRMLYNRASADPDGNPWSERKRYVWWDAAASRWTGPDVPDFPADRPPGYRPPADTTGMDAIAGDAPFIMKPDGRGWLFAPRGVKDGPLPTHYEPAESPIRNPLYARQESPSTRHFAGEMNALAAAASEEFPVVACTFRLTEHYLSGPMSRFNSWLIELQPAMFVELSPELAAERGINHGGWVVVASARGRIEARAMVTRRIRPMDVDGRTIHQVGLPFHWGYAGEAVGGNANDLTALIADPNVSMHEGKVFAVQVTPGRLAPDLRLDAPSEGYAAWPTRDRSPDTPDAAQPEGQFRSDA
jgi:formate dehydrogenase major subunit